MQHKCYFEITADSPYNLGLERGKLFGDIAQKTLASAKEKNSWVKKIEASKAYLEITERFFPDLVEELRGYGKASNISFSDMWAMSLEDDLDDLPRDKCTTVVTNNGFLISHNEDWDEVSENNICVLKKTLNGVTTFELFYLNTLGGASACINSHGIAMMINTLTHTDHQIGVPRNVIARWLSESSNPEADFAKMKQIPRSLGYDHIFVSNNGEVWNIESSATRQVLTRPSLPFVHTNHFVNKELVDMEENDNSTGTYERYDQACQLVKPQMTVEQIKTLNSTTENARKDTIMNPRTIGKMIIDFENVVAYVWMKRERELGWVEYPLDFI